MSASSVLRLPDLKNLRDMTARGESRTSPSPLSFASTFDRSRQASGATTAERSPQASTARDVIRPQPDKPTASPTSDNTNSDAPSQARDRSQVTTPSRSTNADGSGDSTTDSSVEAETNSSSETPEITQEKSVSSADDAAAWVAVTAVPPPAPLPIHALAMTDEPPAVSDAATLGAVANITITSLATAVPSASASDSAANTLAMPSPTSAIHEPMAWSPTHFTLTNPAPINPTPGNIPQAITPHAEDLSNPSHPSDAQSAESVAPLSTWAWMIEAGNTLDSAPLHAPDVVTSLATATTPAPTPLTALNVAASTVNQATPAPATPPTAAETIPTAPSATVDAPTLVSSALNAAPPVAIRPTEKKSASDHTTITSPAPTTTDESIATTQPLPIPTADARVPVHEPAHQARTALEATSALTLKSGENAPQATPVAPPEKSSDNATSSVFSAPAVTTPATSSTAPTLSHTALDRTSQATPNPMERVVIQQVNRALIQQSASGDRMLVVRLTPPELGTVRVEIVEHQGTLSAHLHSDDDAVRTALERALPTMRQELRASDAPIRELSMGNQSLADRPFNQDHPQHQPSQHGNHPGKSGNHPHFSVETPSPGAPVNATARSLGARIDGRGVDALA